MRTFEAIVETQVRQINRREASRYHMTPAQMGIGLSSEPGAEVLDYSHGGLRLRTSTPLAEGTRHRFTVSLPCAASRDITFQVRWSKGCECGLEAVNTPEVPEAVRLMTEAVMALVARSEAA